MGMKISDFGKTAQGLQTHLYTLANQNGMVMEVTDYGATLVSLVVPDAAGRMQDVLLGYEDVKDYEQGTGSFGACIGRNGNRIRGGQVPIGGHVYQMEQNEGENCLHSGSGCYSRLVWKADVLQEGAGVRFHHVGADGEQGLPGMFDVTVTYTLTDDNAVKIHYEGVSDKDTIANLTNHAYFNLAGHDAGSILGHILRIDADAYTPVDAASIPTGEIASVAGTPFDFRTAKEIGTDIDADEEQLRITGGYDHNYVLRDSGGRVRTVAVVYEKTTGRRMEVLTDTVGMQFYTGNFIEERPVGKDGVVYAKRGGLCLETQYFPDAVHHAAFPSSVLRAGQPYDTTTIYRFSVSE